MKKNTITIGVTIDLKTNKKTIHEIQVSDTEYKEYLAFREKQCEQLARCLLPAIQEYCQSEEGKKEYEKFTKNEGND